MLNGGISHEYCIIVSNLLRIIQKCCKKSLLHQRFLTKRLIAHKYLFKFTRKQFCQLPEIHFYILKLYKLMIPFMRESDNNSNNNDSNENENKANNNTNEKTRKTIEYIMKEINKYVRIDIGDRWLENQNLDFNQMMNDYESDLEANQPKRDSKYYDWNLLNAVSKADYFNDDLLKPYKYYGSPKLNTVLMAPQKRNEVLFCIQVFIIV